MKGSIKILPITAGLLGLCLLASCKHDNQFKQQLADSTLTKPFAKYLKLASNYTTRASGASSPVLMSSQNFDSGYWGWNDDTAYLSSPINLVVHHNFAQPLPTESYQNSFLIPFGDGTWPNNYVSTGVIRPKAITGYTYINYDTTKTDITPTVPNTYTVQYDTQTGVETSAVYSVYDSTGVLSTKKVTKFSADPRSYSAYYNAGYSLYTGAAETLSGSTVTTIEVSNAGKNSLETYTYKNFDAAGALADFASNSFGKVNGSTVLKKVTTIGTYADATTDISANTVQTTTSFYSDATTVVYKSQQSTTYNNLTNRIPQSVIAATYTVAAGVETLETKTVSTYSNGFLATKVDYTVAAGAASVAFTSTYTRNTQGRPTKMSKKDGAGIVFYQEDYTYDSTGRLLTYRPSNVATDGVLTCVTGSYDQSYNTTTSVAGATINVVTKTTYPCVANAVSVDPNGKSVTTYNTEFLPSTTQTYTYGSGTFAISAQTDYTYNSSNQVTKQQDYTIAQSIATPSTYTEYSYDTNGFLVSSIGYLANGTPSAPYTVYAYTYK